ncbi:hypothetical protein [Paenibacillus cremeus]|uniref:hypothetical protein n=1 Tax=Paenibacillus cremeus TaxID=2163881 RepID=UPI0021BD1B6D|nr:hypothetical protein [Paenibacillus cremeus]
MNLLELEKLHADIEAIHEIVLTLKASIDGKDVGIHILKNSAGSYFYELSHAYRGADRTDRFSSMENRYASVEEAAKGALQSATLYYRSTDEGGAWQKNESYVQ